MTPINKHFIARQAPAPIFSPAGLTIPEIARRKPNKATVLAVADDCEFVRVGDSIIFERGTEYYIEEKREELLLMGEAFVLCRQTCKDDLELPRGHIMVQLSSDDRRKLFEKPITTTDGRVINLVIKLEAFEQEDAWYEQRMSHGEIVGVGADMGWIMNGDIAILDYTVDADPKRIVHEDADGKYIVIDSRVAYCDSDIILYANRKTPHDTIIQNKGDVEFLTPLLFVKRGDSLIANAPWVVLEHVKLNDEFEESEGSEIATREVMTRIVHRKILATSDDSSYKPGQTAVIEWDCIFDKYIDGAIVEVALEDDILFTQ